MGHGLSHFSAFLASFSIIVNCKLAISSIRVNVHFSDTHTLVHLVSYRYLRRKQWSKQALQKESDSDSESEDEDGDPDLLPWNIRQYPTGEGNEEEEEEKMEEEEEEDWEDDPESLVARYQGQQDNMGEQDT